jgi:hypothetical protein
MPFPIEKSTAAELHHFDAAPAAPAQGHTLLYAMPTFLKQAKVRPSAFFPGFQMIYEMKSKQNRK